MAKKTGEQTETKSMAVIGPRLEYALASLAGGERESHEEDLDRWFPRRSKDESNQERERRLDAAADAWAACRVLWLQGEDDPASLIRSRVREDFLRVSLARTSSRGSYPDMDSARQAVEAWEMLGCLRRALKARKNGIEAATAAALKAREAQWKRRRIEKTRFGIWPGETVEVPMDWDDTQMPSELQGRDFTVLAVAPNVGILSAALSEVANSKKAPVDLRLMELVLQLRPGAPDEPFRLKSAAHKALRGVRRRENLAEAEAGRLGSRDSGGIPATSFASTQTYLDGRAQDAPQGEQDDAIPQDQPLGRVHGGLPPADPPILASPGAGPEVREDREPHPVRHEGPRRVHGVAEVQQHRRGPGSRAPQPEGGGDVPRRRPGKPSRRRREGEGVDPP